MDGLFRLRIYFYKDGLVRLRIYFYKDGFVRLRIYFYMDGLVRGRIISYIGEIGQVRYLRNNNIFKITDLVQCYMRRFDKYNS